MKIALQASLIFTLFLIIAMSLFLALKNGKDANAMDHLEQGFRIQSETQGETIPGAAQFWSATWVALAIGPMCAFAIFATVVLRRKWGTVMGLILIGLAALLYFVQPRIDGYLFPVNDTAYWAIGECVLLVIAGLGLVILSNVYFQKSTKETAPPAV